MFQAAENCLFAAADKGKTIPPVTDRQALQWVSHSVRMFKQAEDFLTAAEILKSLNRFTDAIGVLTNAGLFGASQLLL